MNEMTPIFRLLIDQDKCDRCTSRGQPACTEACPHGAVYPDVNSNYVWVDCDLSGGPDLCRKCVEGCPRKAIEVKKIPPPKIKEQSITYFETPGIQNTTCVVDVVTNRISQGGIGAVVVASCSGSSALMLAESLRSHSVKIINISPPTEALEEMGWQPISKKMAQRLMKLGVVCRELFLVNGRNLGNGHINFPEKAHFFDWQLGSEYPVEHLEKVFNETLISVGGMGLKTAVECMFSACQYGDMEVGEKIIGTAGSGWGLDTAVVIGATTPEKCFGTKPSERLEIQEILAMPINKQRWG